MNYKDQNRANQRKSVFAERLNICFKKWHDLDPKHNTQVEFARQISELRHSKTGEECPVTNRYVNNWLKGKWFPKMYIPEIVEVLGIAEEELFSQTDDELYKLSSDYISTFARNDLTQYCNEIGLNLQLLRLIRSMMGIHFDIAFPTWTPIEYNTNQVGRLFESRSYIRRGPEAWMESAEIDEPDLRVLQYEITIEENGEFIHKLLPFTYPDLLFLKEVQDEILDFVDYKMIHRMKELLREVDEANELAHPKDKNGVEYEKILTPEELNQIDRYHDYTGSKKRRK